MNGEERAAAAARRLFDEHRARKTFAVLPEDLRPRSLDEAHAIQERLQRLNEGEGGLGPLAGWKVALTTPVMQRLAGIGHPCAGGIHSSFVYRSPATLHAGDYVRIGVEAEIAVRLATDLTGGGQTRDSVADAVGALIPALEIVDDRGVDYGALDGLMLVADNSFNFGTVLGPETPDWRDLDLPSLSGRMSINGEVVGEGVGSAVMGHPFEALAWLAGALDARGLALRAGEIVMTGSIVATKWPAAGDEVVFDLDPLGETRLRLG